MGAAVGRLVAIAQAVRRLDMVFPFFRNQKDTFYEPARQSFVAQVWVLTQIRPPKSVTAHPRQPARHGVYNEVHECGPSTPDSTERSRMCSGIDVSDDGHYPRRRSPSEHRPKGVEVVVEGRYQII